MRSWRAADVRRLVDSRQSIGGSVLDSDPVSEDEVMLSRVGVLGLIFGFDRDFNSLGDVGNHRWITIRR